MSSKTSIAAAAALAVVSWGASTAVAVADPTPAPPGPAAPAGGLKTTIDGDGLFIVGKDIAPGTYATAGPVGDKRCYWRRMNNVDPHAKNNVIDSAMTAKPMQSHSLCIAIADKLRERMEGADIPESFKGAPIAFVTAGLMSLAFMGFAGLVK